MKPGLLLCFALGPFEAALGEHFTVHRRPEPSEREAFYAEHGAKITAVVTMGSLGLPNDEIEALPALGLIACFSAGHDGIDLDLCRERGVKVTACPGANAADVADMAIALLLAVARNIVVGDRFMRDGLWREDHRGDLRDGVSGTKLGLLGLGAIGQAIAKRALGFDMEVAYCTRTPRPDLPYRHVPAVLDLAKTVDHLIIACPLTPATEGLVTADVLTALGPKGILVNIARGPVVDEAALLSALQANAILGAGLDVFAQEPDFDKTFRTLTNVVLMPHHGGFTRRVLRTLGGMVLANLNAFRTGGALQGVVA